MDYSFQLLDFTLRTADGLIGINMCWAVKEPESSCSYTVKTCHPSRNHTHPLASSRGLGAKGNKPHIQWKEKLSSPFSSSQRGQRKQRSILYISSHYRDGLVKCREGVNYRLAIVWRGMSHRMEDFHVWQVPAEVTVCLFRTPSWHRKIPKVSQWWAK